MQCSESSNVLNANLARLIVIYAYKAQRKKPFDFAAGNVTKPIIR